MRVALVVALWSLLSQATLAQTSKSLYFPPAGEGLDKQQLRQPEAVGLKPAVIAQLKGTATRWALWRDGYLVHVEGDFNQKEDVYSLRKTWHALTVGAAIKQGRIPSIKQPLSVWEKDLTGNDARATWQHVLTQSAGFDYPYGKYPDYQPGEMWTYSDHHLRRLTSALAKVYGKQHLYDRYDDVFKAAYFDAIGMRGWFTSKHAEDDGPRLNLDLEDLGRLGLLVLARGEWQGKEIVPRWFVEQLETKQTRGMKVNYDGPNDGRPSLLYGHEDKFPEAPYGYLTWVNTDGDVYPKADRAWAWGAGRGGHMVFWNHKLGIVFACHGRKAEAVIPEIIEANFAATQKAAAQSKQISTDAPLINDPLQGKTAGTVRGKGEFVAGGGWRSHGGLIVLDAGRHIEHGYFEAKLRDFIAPVSGVGKLHVFSGWETADLYNQRDEQGSFWNWRIGDHYRPFKVFAAPRRAGRQELHVMWPELEKFNDGGTHTFRTVWSGGRTEFYIDGELVRYFESGRLRVRYFTLGNDTFDLVRAADRPPIISDVKVVDLGRNGAAALMSRAGWQQERTNQPVTYFDKDGVIAIEAETFTAQLTPAAAPEARRAKWVSRTDVQGFGGASYLTTQPTKLAGGGYQFGKGAYVTYEIEVKEPGKYYTGVRGYALDGGPGATPGAHDSIFLTINGHPVGRTSWKGSAFKNQWHWAFSDEDVQGVFPVYLAEGKTTVEMYVRELGVIVDQIILVRDKKLMPTGDAPLQIVAGRAK